MSISETSQKEERNFDGNIAMDGHRLLFSTRSKTSRGGVAIYVRNDLGAFERDALNIMDANCEAVWIEMEMEKAKNIISGCVYRHPSSDMN